MSFSENKQISNKKKILYLFGWNEWFLFVDFVCLLFFLFFYEQMQQLKISSKNLLGASWA